METQIDSTQGYNVNSILLNKVMTGVGGTEGGLRRKLQYLFKLIKINFLLKVTCVYLKSPYIFYQNTFLFLMSSF